MKQMLLAEDLKPNHQLLPVLSCRSLTEDVAIVTDLN